MFLIDFYDFQPIIYFMKEIKDRKIVSALLIFILVAAVISAVVVAVVRNDELNTKKYPFCEAHPDKCQNVDPEVQEYIFENYEEENQVQSLLQVSSAFGQLEQASEEEEELVYPEIFQRAFRSAECMEHVFGEAYLQILQQVQELYTDTESEAEKFLRMIELFDGQPLSLTDPSRILSVCNFTLNTNSTQNQRRRLQNSTSQQLCYERTSTLHYVSGVGYSISGAMENLRKIRKVIERSEDVHFDAGITFAGPWRRELTLFEELQLIVQEKLLENGHTVSRFQILQYIISYISFLLDPSTDALSRLVFFIINQFFLERLLNVSQNYVVSFHTEMVEQHIREGKKVVIVAHSQGSLYANSIYESLDNTQKASVSLVFVAPSASYMADRTSNYLTNPSDMVVQEWNYISSNFNGFEHPLTANVEGRNFAEDLTNHNFIGYLSEYESEFLEKIKDADDNSVIPISTENPGPITVELTWDEQPDIDLHIFEPHGSHIYYWEKRGDSGFLDVDDVTSWGPEHYFTFCDAIQVGVYEVRFNYYRGYAASRVVARVNAGDRFYIMDYMTSDECLYSAGNREPPYFICKIVVGYNEENDYYTFDILTEE